MVKSTMECVGDRPIRGYDEDLDEFLCFSFNEELLDEIQSRGWILRDKLAEGGIADVFNVIDVRDPTRKAVLILQSRGPAFDDILEVARGYPDIFHATVAYTADQSYPEEEQDFSVRTIQVIEKMDMDLQDYDQKYFNGELSTSSETKSFKDSIERQIYQMRLKLYHDGYLYYDIKSDNIGVNINPDNSITLKLIDIASLRAIDYSGFSAQSYMTKLNSGIFWE